MERAGGGRRRVKIHPYVTSDFKYATQTACSMDCEGATAFKGEKEARGGCRGLLEGGGGRREEEGGSAEALRSAHAEGSKETKKQPKKTLEPQRNWIFPIAISHCHLSFSYFKPFAFHPQP